MACGGAGGRFGLGTTDVLGPMGDLALEIGERNSVEIRDPDGAHPSGRQVEDDRAAQPARPYHQNLGGVELRLAHPTHFAQHDMAGVALEFFVGKGHGSSS